MVIGTDIEDGMVFAVIPANELIVLLDEREETVFPLTTLLSPTHLCQKPRTADNGMGFQQFETCRGLHLAGDDRCQILLNRQLVDGSNLVRLHHQSQCAQEDLRLFTFPVEIHPDGHIEERERGIGMLRCEGQRAILVAVPQDATLREFHRLLTLYCLAFGSIGTIQCKMNLLTTDDTHLDIGLLAFGFWFLANS